MKDTGIDRRRYKPTTALPSSRSRRHLPVFYPGRPAAVAILLFILLVLNAHKGDGLVITHMTVPSYVQRGSDAVLRCQYDLDGQSLYSVKWYKGRHEFFSYFPNEVPQFRVISWSNLTIQYDVVEKGKVYLKSVTREAEGRYKCEVSTEAPLFNTDYREDDLFVYDVSSDGPVVVADARNDLKPGSQLRFTCSFSKSRPKPLLTWYVDGQESLRTKLETRYVLLDSNPSWADDGEWWSAESELSLWPSVKQLERKWLQVTCRAVVLNETVYQRMASLNVTAAASTTSSLAQQIQRASSRPSSSSSSSSSQVSASMASSQHSRDSYSFSATNTGGRGGTARTTMALTGRLPLLELLWLFVVGLSAALLS